MTKTVRILSIDGGGVRGIVPAAVLHEIEKRCRKPIHELFDLIAGTSTGGILAAGLTKPAAKNSKKPAYSTEDLLDLYEQQGKIIFGKSATWEIIERAKYPGGNIEKVLKNFFGDSRLSESLTPVLIPSYEIEHRIPMIFNSRRAAEDPGWDFETWKVIRATSAAPIFFPPFKLTRKELPLFIDWEDRRSGQWKRKNVSYYALADGGIYANNPTMCAMAEVNRYRGDNADAQQFIIVSIGTGGTTDGVKFADVAGSGLCWIKITLGVPLISCFFQGMSETVDFQCHKIFSHAPHKYFRLQGSITKEQDPMDNVKPENVKALRRIGEKIAADRHEELDAICTELCKA